MRRRRPLHGAGHAQPRVPWPALSGSRTSCPGSGRSWPESGHGRTAPGCPGPDTGIKGEGCGCRGEAEQLQRAYGKQVKGAEIPQAVLDNYLAMETCYREVNEGKR